MTMSTLARGGSSSLGPMEVPLAIRDGGIHCGVCGEELQRKRTEVGHLLDRIQAHQPHCRPPGHMAPDSMAQRLGGDVVARLLAKVTDDSQQRDDRLCPTQERRT